MAIAKINKIELIGLQKDKEELLALLQKLGMVELLAVQETSAAAGLEGEPPEVNILEIEEAISFLDTFRQIKISPLKSLVTLKPQVLEKELKEIIHGFDYPGLLKELSVLRNHLKSIHQHQERLIQEKLLLSPWRRLKIPLDEICYTQNCGMVLGVLNRRDYPNLLENLEKEGIKFFCEEVNYDQANAYLAILYAKGEFQRLEPILKNHHFNFVTLGYHKGTAEDRLFEINREVLVLEDQLEDIKSRISGLSGQQFKLMVVYDYLSNIQKRRQVNKNLSRQQFTFALSGWVKNRDLKLLEKEIAQRFQDAVIYISEAREDEETPVILQNRRLIEPFEFITGIYGMPKYNELDPTPFLAPFFFLYFGLCVSDAGYGFILAVLCWLILKKFKMGPQGNKFFRLFLFCGFSTIIVGALTGSWFGNLPDLLADNNKAFFPLKKFKDSLIVLDPMKEPTKLLGIALSLGIVQVWFGNVVAVIGNIKNKRYLDIFLDQVPMLTLLFGLTGLGLIFLKLSTAGQINLFRYAAASGGLALVLTQGRSEKGIGTKLFYGAYNLYNALSGYLSDVLSYSRLWALGLVTGVMATTINLISIQFSQIFSSFIPFANKVGFIKALASSIIIIAIFICGHLVSFLMNLLGAFVHPLRLQFVEFFSKFFKSGGSTFKPFKVETKYTNLN